MRSASNTRISKRQLFHSISGCRITTENSMPLFCGPFPGLPPPGMPQSHHRRIRGGIAVTSVPIPYPLPSGSQRQRSTPGSASIPFQTDYNSRVFPYALYSPPYTLAQNASRRHSLRIPSEFPARHHIHSPARRSPRHVRATCSGISMAMFGGPESTEQIREASRR
jgi:hypothetical protein